MGGLVIGSGGLGQIVQSIKIPQHLIEINFSMTNLIKDSAINIAVQAYDGQAKNWQTIISGPADTFQSVGDNYQVRTYYPANGVAVELRLLATMENGDSIPSATNFTYTPTLASGESINIKEFF